jgi:hypothetical protein
MKMGKENVRCSMHRTCKNGWCNHLEPHIKYRPYTSGRDNCERMYCGYIGMHVACKPVKGTP